SRKNMDMNDTGDALEMDRISKPHPLPARQLCTEDGLYRLSVNILRHPDQKMLHGRVDIVREIVRTKDVGGPLCGSRREVQHLGLQVGGNRAIARLDGRQPRFILFLRRWVALEEFQPVRVFGGEEKESDVGTAHPPSSRGV